METTLFNSGESKLLDMVLSNP